MEVTLRTLHGRLLLRPSSRANDLIVGVIGRDLRSGWPLSAGGGGAPLGGGGGPVNYRPGELARRSRRLSTKVPAAMSPSLCLVFE